MVKKGGTYLGQIEPCRLIETIQCFLNLQCCGWSIYRGANKELLWYQTYKLTYMTQIHTRLNLKHESIHICPSAGKTQHIQRSPQISGHLVPLKSWLSLASLRVPTGLDTQSLNQDNYTKDKETMTVYPSGDKNTQGAHVRQTQLILWFSPSP